MALELALGGGDSVQVRSFFINDDPRNAWNPVQQVKFVDGTVWDLATLAAQAFQGSSGDDTLRGTTGADTLTRQAGAGLIQQVHARRGDMVREGQLLVTIESSVERSAAEPARHGAEAQGALQVASNRAEAARDKAKRVEALYAEQFVSAQARDDDAAELKVADAEPRSAQEAQQLAQLEHKQSADQLQRRPIRSPFSGVVVDQYLFPGARRVVSPCRCWVLCWPTTRPGLVRWPVVAAPARRAG